MRFHNTGAGDVSVLVPYRSDDGPRNAAWTWVREWWRSHYPAWTLIEGNHDGGPWSKATAVRDALNHESTNGTVLVVADADVICGGVQTAVDAVTAGARWAVPHRRVHRLTRAATESVYAGGDLPDPSRAAARRAPHQSGSGSITESYTGIAGGGVVVLPADRYERLPLDPRFRGWGQEDASWGHALTVLYGHPWRGDADLFHLWHPPPIRMSRSIGSPDNLDLHRRYRVANTSAAILAILAELDAATQ